MGEEVLGHPPLGGAEGHLVHLAGEKANGPGQILHHGKGQLRGPGDLLGHQLPVDGDQLAGGHGHGGGHPGQLVEEGGFSEQAARAVDVQNPFVAVLGLDKALDPALLEKVEAGSLGALEIDEEAGGAGDGGPVLGEGLPDLGREAHGVLGKQFQGMSPPRNMTNYNIVYILFARALSY